MQDSYIITIYNKNYQKKITKKYAKFGPKSQSTTKYRMFRAKKYAS